MPSDLEGRLTMIRELERHSIFDAFLDWKPSEHRACDCGSFDVRYCRTAPRGIEISKYVCDSCGFVWFEAE